MKVKEMTLPEKLAQYDPNGDVVRCNKCMTVYKEEELALLWDDGEAFKGCRKCNTDDYLMDMKREDEQ